MLGTDHSSMADHSAEADVEGAVAFGAMMEAFLAAFDALPGDQQVVLAMRYHQEVTDFEVIAKELNLEELRVRELHAAAVLAVHRALLAAVA